jgi:urease accessory protein
MASLPTDPIAAPPVLQRARGRADVGFRLDEGATRLDRLFQEGQAKIRLPKVHGATPATAVLINTGGGIAGGDRIAWGARFGAGTRALVTSQAAERVYRSSTTDGELSGEIDSRLEIGDGARAEWLPQETILFDRAALSRRLDVTMAADASALMVEAIVLGRTAMGEEVETCRLVDRWRIRRGGRLVFADTFRVEGAARTLLAGAATGGGARAFATVVFVDRDAETRLDEVRALLATGSSAGGASAFDGLLVIRLAHGEPARLKAELSRLLVLIRRAELPRVWSC